MTARRVLSPFVLTAALCGLGVSLPWGMVQAEGVAAQTVGNGLRLDAGPWSRWQGRIGMTVLDTGLAGPGGRVEGAVPVLHGLSLLGDYYFLQQGVTPASAYAGGFRATGGLLIGSSTGPWALAAGPAALGQGFSASRHGLGLAPPQFEAPDTSVPYIGVGYTGLQALRQGSWGFSADVGLMALRPRSAVRLGQDSVGDVLRDLQLSPLLQLGVSYSF